MLVDEAKYLDGKRIHGEVQNSDSQFTWVGLVDASESELKIFQNKFHLNPLAVEDALSNTQRPKLDQYREHKV